MKQDFWRTISNFYLLFSIDIVVGLCRNHPTKNCYSLKRRKCICRKSYYQNCRDSKIIVQLQLGGTIYIFCSRIIRDYSSWFSGIGSSFEKSLLSFVYKSCTSFLIKYTTAFSLMSDLCCQPIRGHTISEKILSGILLPYCPNSFFLKSDCVWVLITWFIAIFIDTEIFYIFL